MSIALGYVSYYVSDVASALDFYVQAFGLEQRFLTPEHDYGELATGDTVLSFVAHELADHNLSAAGGFVPLDAATGPVGATIVLITDDVPAAVEAAVAAGARPYTDPVDKPWGQTVAYVVDPSGILVELATPVASG